MPSAWTQNFYHTVFSTKQRAGLITPELETRLYWFAIGRTCPTRDCSSRSRAGRRSGSTKPSPSSGISPGRKGTIPRDLKSLATGVRPPGEERRTGVIQGGDDLMRPTSLRSGAPVPALVGSVGPGWPAQRTTSRPVFRSVLVARERPRHPRGEV